MFIVSSLDLRPYVGQRIVIRDIQAHRRRRLGSPSGLTGTTTLEDPKRGRWDGPIYVVRQLTRDEYLVRFEAEHARALTRAERVAVNQHNLWFFEISID